MLWEQEVGGSNPLAPTTTKQSDLGTWTKYLMSDKSDSKDINNNLSHADEIVEEIISELPLKERVAIANMNKEAIEILKDIFNKYVRGKTDAEADDSEYTDMMHNLWSKLHKTHRLRVIK